MSILPVKASVKIITNVQAYLFPAEEIKTYHDYLILGGGPAFPSVREAICRERGWLKDQGTNRVVDAGLTLILNFLQGSGPTPPSHNSVGSGINSPAAGDIDLQTSIQRIAITNKYPVSLSQRYDTFWASADGNGTWNETGIHNAASGPTMLCRRLFASAFPKSTANTALVAWTINLVAV